MSSSLAAAPNFCLQVYFVFWFKTIKPVNICYHFSVNATYIENTEVMELCIALWFYKLFISTEDKLYYGQYVSDQSTDKQFIIW